MIWPFILGFLTGMAVMSILLDRAMCRVLAIAAYWRAEHVKAKWEAIAAKEQIIKERDDDIRSADYWKHTED